MKTTALTAAAAGTSHQTRTTSSNHTITNSNNNNDNSSRNAKTPNALSSISSSNLASLATQKHRGNGRVGSGKYYDIASTILSGTGDLETVFLNAAKNGNINKLEQMLSQTGHAALDIDCKDKRTGNTALMWAAKRGHSKVVELLLQHGSDPTLCNYEAQTALELGFAPLKTVLLDWVDIDLPLTSLLLLQAAWQGNLAVLRKILSIKGAKDINCKNSEGLTPLMLVSRDVQLFERLSVQLNRHYNPVEVAEELIKAGADIHATDNDGRSSLHYVSQSRATIADRLVNTLITGGMDPELRDKRLFAPIHLASQVGNTNNVVALVDGGSEVNIQGFAGLTPLHITAYNDHQKTTVSLLSHGADVCITDDRGLTPFDLAKTRKMKITLKEAWIDATKDAEEENPSTFPQSANKGIVNLANKSKADSTAKKKISGPKKRPEVIFDGVINNEVKENSQQRNTPLSTVEKCKQTEKKILEDLEILKAAHPVLQRENSRILGTTRNKILPQIGHSTSPQHSRQNSPDRSNQVVLLAGEEIRRSWEENRQLLLSRGRSVSDIKLGLGRQSRLTSMTSYDGDILVIDELRECISRASSLVFNNNVPHTPRHNQAGSDQVHTSMADIAASCDNFIPNTRGKRNNKTIPLSVNAIRVTPTSSTFITQQPEMREEQKQKSQQQDDKFTQAMASPLELLRCRSLLKEDFILAESRPSEIASGSDPASSTSSLSSSSPRDGSNHIPHSPLRSHKLDSSFAALTEVQENNLGSKGVTQSSQVTENMNTSSINLSQEAKPLIKEPQRHIRRNSENSTLTGSIILNNNPLIKTDYSVSFRTGKGIAKTQSLKRDSKPIGSEFNVSNINKSQSLESLSPRALVQVLAADQNESKINGLSIKSSSLSTEMNSSVQKQVTYSNNVDIDARNEKKSSEKFCEMKIDQKKLNVNLDEQKFNRSQAAPFSGRAKIIGNNEMDRWDSVTSSQEQKESVTPRLRSSKKDSVFLPVKSSKEPSKSASSQNAYQNSNGNSQVTKSCTPAIENSQKEQSRSEEKRPKTSCTENNDTSRKIVSTRNEIVKARHTQETKQSVSSPNQPKEKTIGATSKASTVMCHAQKSSTKSNYDRDFSKSIQDTKSQQQKNPSQTSQSQSSSVLKKESTLSKSCSQFENSKDKSNKFNESHFAVTEESERLGSASKIRMQERLNALRQKKETSSERETIKIKKTDEATPTTAKSKSVNRAAQIESSIRKNQAQSSVIKKSIGHAPNLTKSESIATNKKLTRSSENAIGGVTKTFSSSNVFNKSNESSSPSPQRSISKSSNFVKPPEQILSTNENDASAKTNPEPTPKYSNSVQEKSSSSLARAKSFFTSKSNETYSSDTIKQSTTQPKDTGTAKALDPNVILTPRSTEPLVKIKFDSPLLSKPASGVSVIQKPPPTAVSTPFIVNPYEGFSEKHNPSEHNSTTDAIVRLRKTSQKSGTSSNKVVKKSTTIGKRPTSGSSRKPSSGSKKRVVKRPDSKDETNKEGRVKSGKKRLNQSKKKTEPEITDTKMTADAAKTDVVLISGIGWQLSTSCMDTSSVRVARKVNFQLSSSELDLAASTDVDDNDNDNHEQENYSENPYQNDDQKNKPESQLSPLIGSEDIDSKENLERYPENKALEVFKEKIILNSPRFQEMKRRQESQINIDLPVVTNDGFPPMNLDITQKMPEVNFYATDDHDSKINLEMSHNHIIQREILMDKLTPIPEASFVSKTINAISHFDKSMPEDKLTELLEDPPTVNMRVKNIKKKSSDKSDSSRHRDKSFEKGFRNYEYTSSGKAIRRTQSLRDTSKIGKLPRERKFSESKLIDEEDNIEDVIEEILSTTLSSNASTLKGNNHGSYMSSTNTLTEGDKTLLLKLKSSSIDSPFHAKPANAMARSLDSPLPSLLQDIPDMTNPIENISSQKNDVNGEIYSDSKSVEQAQTSLLQKAQPVSNTGLKISTQKEINSAASPASSHESQGKPPLSSRSSFKQRGTPRSNTPLTRSTSMREPRLKAKGQMDDEGTQERLEFTEEEAKQLARVMSSLRHMELHTGNPLNSSHRDGFGGSAKLLSKTKKMDMSCASAIHSASLAARPSSTGAASKLRGRFHEVKDNGVMPLPCGSQKGNQISGSQQEKVSTDQHKSDKEDSSLPEDGALSAASRPHSVTSSVADATEIENFYIDLTVRRGSLTGSECTVDSSKSEDDTIQWKKGNVLGKGAFGTVWCGLTNEGELIAVKQIELTTMDQSKAQREYEKIQEEVELLKTLEHINIVGYLGTSLEDNIVSIFMQFIPGGSLASILARFGALDESVFRRYTMQILEGVNYLHDNDVIHRDLKGANVMLMPTGVIKLIDFGCAKRLCINLNLSQTEILKSMKGTPYWMAPEVVNETGHGKKSDVWADMNPMAAIFAIGSADRPVPILSDKFSSEAINFVSQCLTRDQEKRPGASDLLNHPFIARKNGRKLSKTVNNENSSTC